MVASTSTTAMAAVLALLVASATAQAPAGSVWECVLAINCGGPAVPAANSSDGHAYLADMYYSPGSLSWSQPAPIPIQHQSLRYANSGPVFYTIPVPTPGYYRANLTFNELYHQGPNRRPMYVGIGADHTMTPPYNDSGLAVDSTSILDIWSLAGGNQEVSVSIVFPSPSTGMSEVWATSSVTVAVFRGMTSSSTALAMLGTLQLLKAVPGPGTMPTPSPTPASTMPSMGTPAPSTSPMATPMPMGPSQYMTLQEQRNAFTANDFAVPLSSVPPMAAMAGSTIRPATANEFPVLAMPDLNVAFTHVELAAATHQVPHTHPRAAEVLLVISGTVDVWFVEENGSPAPRLLRNTVSVNGVALFPRGLIHGVACKAGAPCSYVSTHTHADPGVVSVGPRFCNAPLADVAAALGVTESTAATVCQGMVSPLAAAQPMS
ncbi:hypothetical protein MMPV_005200 [Pyropia vietnamensis]